MKDTPGAANSMLAAASSLFTWSFKDLELEDLRNPAIGIEHFATKKRERFLTPEERQRLQAVIAAGLKIPRPGRATCTSQACGPSICSR
jgi:hypothetical protein